MLRGTHWGDEGKAPRPLPQQSQVPIDSFYLHDKRWFVSAQAALSSSTYRKVPIANLALK